MLKIFHLGLLAFMGLSALGALNAAPLKVVAFGDSTTAKRKGTEIYGKVLQDRLGDDKVNILNKGTPRHTTSLANRRFERDVLLQAPDVVIIQFGINDSAVDVWADPPQTKPRVPIEEYEANLRKFVRESRTLGAEVILMTPNQLRWTSRLQGTYGKPPYDPSDERGFNLYLKDYAEVVRKVAGEEKVQLVDIYAAYDDYEETSGKSASDLLTDGMHPNTEGHKIVADLLEPLLRQLVTEKEESGSSAS